MKKNKEFEKKIKRYINKKDIREIINFLYNHRFSKLLYGKEDTMDCLGASESLVFSDARRLEKITKNLRRLYKRI